MVIGAHWSCKPVDTERNRAGPQKEFKMSRRSKRMVIKVDKDDLKSRRVPLPKQTEQVMPDRRTKRERKGLSKSQLHKLEE